MRQVLSTSVFALIIAFCGLAVADDSVTKILVGTWEGELRIPDDRNPPGRTLVITSLRLEGTRGSAQARYGISGGPLAPVTIAVEVSGKVATLTFSTGISAQITLTLQGEKSLGGTWQASGARSQYPIKFEKVR
jgi:hypothetical protein